MQKYRKKPVVIEAVEVTDALLKGPFGYSTPDMQTSLIDRCIYIDTLEGRMKASMGDYIIRGVRGEFYPCKPDIFAATYEAVNE